MAASPVVLFGPDSGAISRIVRCLQIDGKAAELRSLVALLDICTVADVIAFVADKLAKNLSIVVAYGDRVINVLPMPHLI